MNSAIKTIIAALAITGPTVLPSCAFAQNASPSSHALNGANETTSASQQEVNKKLAVDFYNMALNEKQPAAAMKYISPHFKQHSVLVEDGYAGLQKFLEWVRMEQPKLHADITRSFADGSYVILDVHMICHPGDRGLAIAEIYRVQDGKLAEHWDRI